MEINLATFTYYSVFLKIDDRGNVIISKVFSNNIDKGGAINIKYLELTHIINDGSNNIIMNGLINKALSYIGYSDNSYIDLIVFSFDSNGNTQWTTILDNNLSYDSSGDMAIYDSIIYSTTFSGEGYPWFFSMNSTNGNYLQSNIFTSFGNTTGDVKGKMTCIKI